MARTIPIRLCGVEFLAVDPATYAIAKEAFEDEIDIKDSYWRDFAPGDVVVDVGALWGSYTLPALAQGAEVIAVEPMASAAETLAESVAANGWTCRIERVVLFDGTPYPPDLCAEVFGQRYPERDLVFSTLDELALGDVTQIKLDVEGAELGVIRGGLGMIRRCHPRLLIEAHDGVYAYCAREGTTAKLTALLRAEGYDVAKVNFTYADGSWRNMLIGSPT